MPDFGVRVRELEPRRWGGLSGRPVAWLDRLASAAPAWAWRLLNPACRERFADLTALPALRRVEVAGGGGTLLCLPTAPGATAEPVLLAHAVGWGPDVFRYGQGLTLAHRLRLDGYQVYLWAMPGDREADGSGAAMCFDRMVRTAVPSAVAAALKDSGARRLHWVGHGLGGQLGLAWASRGAGDGLASVATLGAAVVFPRMAAETVAASEGRAWQQLGTQVGVQVLARLPEGWRLPRAAWAPTLAVLHGGKEGGRRALQAAAMPDGPGRRGALCQVSEDVPLAWARAARRWLAEGNLSDEDGVLDYLPGLGAVDVPLWWAASPQDALCPPAWAQPVAQAWGGPCDGVVLTDDAAHGIDHAGLLLSRSAQQDLHGQLLAWLAPHRERAWFEDGAWCTLLRGDAPG